MTQRIIHIWLALVTIVGSVSAQSLSVQPIEVQTGEQTEVVVSLTGATAMTALQFNLQLPTGLTATADNVTLGAATDGHTLSVQTLDGGDLLFVLYSMDLKAFKDGELLRIPVTAGNAAVNTTGQLYTIRAATADAVSHTLEGSTFGITTTDGIINVNDNVNDNVNVNVNDNCYDLSGRKVVKPTKGISVRNGRKVVIKR